MQRKCFYIYCFAKQQHGMSGSNFACHEIVVDASTRFNSIIHRLKIVYVFQRSKNYTTMFHPINEKEQVLYTILIFCCTIILT